MTYKTKKHNALHYLTRKAQRRALWAKIESITNILAQIKQAAV